MTVEDDVAWAVEAACLNAWPSPRQVLLGSFLVRVSGGVTRRTNSINPLRAARHDVGAVFDACATIYAAHDQPLIFRVPSLVAGLDAALDAKGLVAQDECCTLAADLTVLRTDPDPGVTLDREPDAGWLAFRSRVNAAGPAADRIYETMLGHILLPTVFAAVRIEGEVAAAAYGVVDRSWLVLESVATAPAFRNRGLARRTVAELMLWGRSKGATGAALQVVADNAPARALYARLGFTRELYRYHYRRFG